MQRKQIDLSKSLKHFFELKDWQTRVLFFGGIYFLGIVGFMVASFVFIIPLLGLIIGCFAI